MKKNILAILSLILLALVTTTAQAEMDHSGHQGHDHSMHQEKPNQNEHDMHAGHKCQHDNGAMRQTMIDGHHIRYELIDMRGRMGNMNMPADMKSHHLMVYIKDAANNVVEKAKTGFLVIGPDGTKQKAMAMGMGGGYGADINLMEKGAYTIKTKVVAGSKKLSDSFEHIVK